MIAEFPSFLDLSPQQERPRPRIVIAPSAWIEKETPKESPMAMLDQLHDAAVKALNPAFDTEEANVRNTIANDRRLLMDQYRVDRDLLRKSTNQEEYATRVAALKASYEKRWLTLKAKVQPDLDRLGQQRQEATLKLNLDRAQKQIELQKLQELIDRGVLTADQGLREQYQTLGLTLPEPQKPQTARQRLADITPIWDAWKDEEAGFRINKKTGKVQVPIPADQWTGGTPASPQPTEKEWVDADEEKNARFWWLQRNIDSAEREINELRKEVFMNRPVPNLRSSAPTPFAQTIRSHAGAPTEIEDMTQIVDEEELKRIAGIK